MRLLVNGSGSDIVSGKKTPYTFVVNMTSLEKIDGNYTSEQTLTKSNLNNLIKIMHWLEEYEGCPVDVEFLIEKNTIYIVQVRPITTFSNDNDSSITETGQSQQGDDSNLLQADSVIERLYSDGFDKYLCSNGYDHRISVGTYSIQKGADYSTIAKMITNTK